MKPAVMVRMLLASLFLPGAAMAGDDQARLSFRQDGKDLVVTMTTEIVDRPHVLWTDASKVVLSDDYLLGPRQTGLERVELRYHILQGRDVPGRSDGKRKTIEIRWRIPNHTRGKEPYVVKQEFTPSTAELKQLMPRLTKLIEESEQASRDRAQRP